MQKVYICRMRRPPAQMWLPATGPQMAPHFSMFSIFPRAGGKAQEPPAGRAPCRTATAQATDRTWKEVQEHAKRLQGRHGTPAALACNGGLPLRPLRGCGARFSMVPGKDRPLGVLWSRWRSFGSVVSEKKRTSRDMWCPKILSSVSRPAGCGVRFS